MLPLSMGQLTNRLILILFEKLQLSPSVGTESFKSNRYTNRLILILFEKLRLSPSVGTGSFKSNRYTNRLILTLFEKLRLSPSVGTGSFKSNRYTNRLILTLFEKLRLFPSVGTGKLKSNRYTNRLILTLFEKPRLFPSVGTGNFKSNRYTNRLKAVSSFLQPFKQTAQHAALLFGLLGSFPLSAFMPHQGGGQGLCLSPMEIAALFSTQRSGGKKGQIKAKRKQISEKEKAIESARKQLEDREEKAEEFLTKFTDTLNKSKFHEKTSHSSGFYETEATNYTPQNARNQLKGYIRNSRSNFTNCPAITAPIDPPPKCYDWQVNISGQKRTDLLKPKGKIDESFCDSYSTDASKCKDALKDAMTQYDRLKDIRKKTKDRIADLEESIRELEDEANELEDELFLADDDEETEAGGLCFECLQELRDANAPSAWQRVGSGLTAALGAGLSIFGLREARRAQRSANELLALQGFPPENNFGYNLAGLSLGFPFLAQGLNGLSRGSMSQGGVGCSQTASPYSPYMMNMAGMQQYQSMASMQQYQSMFNPMAGMQYQAMLNPMMNMHNPMMMMNPMAGMQFQAMLNPMMNMHNPMMMMNPMAGMQFQAMLNPMGNMFNPMGGMQQYQSMFNPMGNMMMNPMNHYSAMAQSQMQMRLQMQQTYMAQQQAAYQDWMHRQKIVGELSQQLVQIQHQMQMVMAGGTTTTPTHSSSYSHTSHTPYSHTSGPAPPPPSDPTHGTTGTGGVNWR